MHFIHGKCYIKSMSVGDFEISGLGADNGTKGFNLEQFLEKNKLFIALALFGVILIGLGVLVFEKQVFSTQPKIEVLESATNNHNNEIIIEVSGAVVNPGVYKLSGDKRIEDALILAGGLSENADRNWVGKNLNRAAKLTDGQKIFIPLAVINKTDNQQTLGASAKNGGVYQTNTLSYSDDTEEKTNINNASLESLDKLPGIGPVYGKKIIEQRPYSNIEELQLRKVIPKSTYEKIKNLITVY